MSSGKLLLHYLRPQAPRVILLAVLILFSIAMQLINPQIIRYYLDTAQSGGAQRSLLLAAALFIAFALAQQALSVAALYVSQNVSWSATNRLRADLALYCLHLDLSFHKRHTPGELIERIDGDVTGLANFFSEFAIRVLGNALIVIGILFFLFRENVILGLGLAAYSLATLVALAVFQRLAVPRWVAARQASADQYGFLEERISGSEEFRANGVEAYMIYRLLHLMQVFLEKYRMSFLMGTLTTNLTNLLYVVGYTIGLSLGIILYLRGQVTLGTAYLIVFYVGMLAAPLQSIREQAQDFQQASASALRIQELFQTPPAVQDLGTQPTKARSALPGFLPPEGPSSIEFQQVSFRYEDGDNTLYDVSFHLQPGRVLGILGRTGSGKSTLARLLFRLYDPTSGVICLDGMDIRSLLISDLRQREGMVTQDVQLFQASLRNNLTFFNPRISDDQLLQALEELRILDWVGRMPRGLDTPLAAGGEGFSAGELQLLAFTRIFLKNPGVVILDEASSRLDLATETLLDQAIQRLFQSRTGVIIAHKLQTVQRADDILILEKGRVIEYGPRLSLAADPSTQFSRLLQTGLEEALS
jgi:ABC-type multidrug transport system fused ATPase/permease subunit